MGNPGWHEDGVDDGPSSLDMLLGWMRTRNNAERWMDTAGKMDGSRLELAHEIQDFMCECGIDYRTAEGIRTRLLILERELQDAEAWMKDRGLRHHNVSKKTEQAVLQMCPYYVEIKPLFRAKRLSSTTPIEPQTSPYQEEVASTEGDTEGHTSDEAHNKSRKRRSTGGCLDMSKRIRVERPRFWEGKTEDTKCVAVLEAEPDERREFFELELQVKRDHAICVRAKARKELLDLGVHLDTVDRLLPL